MAAQEEGLIRVQNKQTPSTEIVLARYFQWSIRNHQIVFWDLAEDDQGYSLTPRSARPATQQEIELWAYTILLFTFQNALFPG